MFSCLFLCLFVSLLTALFVCVFLCVRVSFCLLICLVVFFVCLCVCMLFVFLCFFLRPEQARAAQGSPEQPRAAQSSQGQFRCGCIAEILIFYCVALCFLELDLSFHVIKPNLPRKPFPPAPDPLKIIQNHLWQASQPASSGHCLFVCFFVFLFFLWWWGWGFV